MAIDPGTAAQIATRLLHRISRVQPEAPAHLPACAFEPAVIAIRAHVFARARTNKQRDREILATGIQSLAAATVAGKPRVLARTRAWPFVMSRATGIRHGAIATRTRDRAATRLLTREAKDAPAGQMHARLAVSANKPIPVGVPRAEPGAQNRSVRTAPCDGQAGQRQKRLATRIVRNHGNKDARPVDHRKAKNARHHQNDRPINPVAGLTSGQQHVLPERRAAVVSHAT